MTSAGRGGSALSGLVSLLEAIDPGRPPRAVIGSGHYASVLAIDGQTGIAMSTDGVGTKVVVAAALRRFDTIGIDCVAMNVNDLICVGAEPIALVDYIAVEDADPELLAAIGRGLKAGAEEAGIEIPGGELAELPELIRGHPSPLGFDLVGTCIGTVPLDAIVSGEAIEPGDAVIGLPSSGIHSNGLTLARKVLLELAGLSLQETPAPLSRTLGEELLEPTEIYVRPVLELLGSPITVHGLAHITGDSLLNLLRLNARIGYDIDDPLPAQPIFALIAESGAVSPEKMYETFNMGTGFCCVVPPSEVENALALLRKRHPGTRRIGEVTRDSGRLRLPSLGIEGTAAGFGQSR